MLTIMSIVLVVNLIVTFVVWANWQEAEGTLTRRRDMWDDSLRKAGEDIYKFMMKFADSDRKLNELRDNVKDTIRILAEHRPIDYEVFKLLVEDCKCDYCVELFRDYLDFSEGFAADAAPTLATDVLAFKEEPTARGNTVTMPTPITIINPDGYRG